MHISHLIVPSRVIANLHGTTAVEVLAEMAELLARDLRHTSKQAMLDIFLEREGLGSTAIGQGIAIPHGRLAELSHPIAALGRSSGGIAFQSLDEKPVHLVIALLSPPGANELHLKALSAISRLLRRESLRDRLCSLSEPEPLFHALMAEEDH